MFRAIFNVDITSDKINKRDLERAVTAYKGKLRHNRKISAPGNTLIGHGGLQRYTRKIVQEFARATILDTLDLFGFEIDRRNLAVDLEPYEFEASHDDQKTSITVLGTGEVTIEATDKMFSAFLAATLGASITEKDLKEV